MARLPTHVIRFQALLGRYRFPIVHLNEAQLIPAAAMAKRAGSHVVWHLRSSLADDGPLRRRLVAASLDRWADATIAIDADVAASFPVRRPIEIVFNAVRVPSGRDGAVAKRDLGVPTDRVSIGFVGHLRRVKGWEDLLRAAALLRGAPVQLVFVGGGVRPPAFFRTPRGRGLVALGLVEDDRRAAVRLAQELRVEDTTSFLPYMSDLDLVYPALDIVAFPNRGTGLGRSVLEAAAYGVPAVASGSQSGGGVLVPDRTGLLVPRRSPERLAAAIESLLDPATRATMGEAARSHAAMFDASRAAQRVGEIYARLLG
jgi:glycosyltransferase involved in cell wall biosynthesis